MKSKTLLILFAMALLPTSFATAQGIFLDSVEGMYGAVDDSVLVADGATEIVFRLRLVGLDVVSGGFTAGLRVYSNDGAQWEGMEAETLDVGTPWNDMFDSPGGFFENHFSVNGSGADTIGLGALAIHGGLPADFDTVAFSITIGPISSDYAGRTICLDSCFYSPNGYWMLAGSGDNFAWGGPYHFTLDKPTGMVDGGADLPTRYALNQNYPNPFNPSTEILFDVPRRSRVTISVYNLIGQKVRTLMDEDLSAGTYTRTFNGQTDDGETISSGVYFYRMKAGDFVQTRKMMMLK